jgi:hypothetical protein
MLYHLSYYREACVGLGVSVSVNAKVLKNRIIA